MQPRATPWAFAAVGGLIVACAPPEPARPAPEMFADTVLAESSFQLLERAFEQVRPGVFEVRRRFEPRVTRTALCPMPVATENRAVPMPTHRPEPTTAAPMPTDTTECRNPLYRRPD